MISGPVEGAIEPVGTLTAASEWVVGLPKVELHLHLEGAMRPETVIDLKMERLDSPGPLKPDWQYSYYTYTDFAGFMRQLTPRFPSEPDEYRRIARECFEDLVAHHVVLAEVSFDVPAHEVGDDSRFWPMIEVLEEERLEAQRRWPIRINWIAGLMRTRPVEVAVYRTQLVIEACKRGIEIAAIDLHGDEAAAPPEPFEPAYRLAAKHGLGARVHAGEASTPASIWGAIDVLGTRRIAHGVLAQEDPVLLERLQRGDVTIEMCPTSNTRTAVVPNLKAHPIRRFFDLGIPVTVNSDDPLPFFTDVEREYRLLVDEFGFNREQLKQVTLNAARAAFLDPDERHRLIELIEIAYSFPETNVKEAAVRD